MRTSECVPNKMTKLPLLTNAWKLETNEAARNASQPAVSVLITLYNYSAFILTCLESVRASKTDKLPGGIEVIVVDDASTDDSAKVVEEYMAAQSLPVRLAKKAVNSGLADARNVGLLVARAPLVFILDADNTIRPDCLEAHYLALESSGHAMAYGYVNRFDHLTLQSIGTMSTFDWNIRDLVSHPCIDAMAMVRKEIVLRFGGYSTEYGTILPQGWEDYDLWLKLAQGGHTGKLIPRILSDYRVHPAAMSVAMWPAQREVASYFSRKFSSLVKEHDDLPNLFGISRRELAVTSGCPAWLQTSITINKPPRWIHRLLGEKLCRSIRKRLSKAYAWLGP